MDPKNPNHVGCKCQECRDAIDHSGLGYKNNPLLTKECWELNKEHVWDRATDGNIYCTVCGGRNVIGGYTHKYLIKYLKP